VLRESLNFRHGSNFPQVRLLDLARLDSEVGEGLPLAGVVEHLHEGGDVRVEHGPVDVPEGLPKRPGRNGTKLLLYRPGS